MGNGPKVTDPKAVLTASNKTKAWFFAGLVFLAIMIFAAQATANVIVDRGAAAAKNVAQGAEGALNSLWS